MEKEVKKIQAAAYDGVRTVPTLNMPICIAPPYDYIKVILIFKKFLSYAMLIKVAVNADNKFNSNNK